MMRSGIQQAVSKRGAKTEDEGALLSLDEVGSGSFVNSNFMALLLLVIYLALGLSWYTLQEGNSPLVAIYFSVTTLMTIGYGDVSVGNRAFGSFFVLLGAGVVGTIFGLVSFRIMEEQETLMNLRLTQLASKLSKMREIRKLKRYPSSSTSCRYSTEESQSSMDSSRIPSTPDSGMSQRWKSFSGAANITIRKALRISPKNEQCDGILDLNMAVYEDEISDLKVTAVGNVLLFFITLFTGAVCMSAIEGWDFTDAVYWSSVTICTVGFGDLSPKTDGGRVFTIFFALIGCTLSVKGFSEVVRFPIVYKLKQNEIYVQKQFLKGLSEKTLKNIIDNDLFERIPNLKSHDSEIKKSEFVIMLLTMMGKLNERDIMLTATIFDKLDYNGDGILNEDEWAAEVRKARTRDRARTMEALEIESQKDNMDNLIKRTFEKALTGAGEGIMAVTDSMRTYGENVVQHLVSRHPHEGYVEETKRSDSDEGPHSSILPRWFRANSSESADNSATLGEDNTYLPMTDNPILISPERLKKGGIGSGMGPGSGPGSGTGSGTGTGGGMSPLSGAGTPMGMGSGTVGGMGTGLGMGMGMGIGRLNKSVRWENEIQAPRELSTSRFSVVDVEISSNSGSADYCYDSDDHDCYGGKDVYDLSSEGSDQYSYTQNYGMASVKIANKRIFDEARLKLASKNLHSEIDEKRNSNFVVSQNNGMRVELPPEFDGNIRNTVLQALQSTDSCSDVSHSPIRVHDEPSISTDSRDSPCAPIMRSGFSATCACNVDDESVGSRISNNENENENENSCDSVSDRAKNKRMTTAVSNTNHQNSDVDRNIAITKNKNSNSNYDNSEILYTKTTSPVNPFSAEYSPKISGISTENNDIENSDSPPPLSPSNEFKKTEDFWRKL